MMRVTRVALHSKDHAVPADAQALQSSGMVAFQALDVQTMPLSSRIFTKLLQCSSQRFAGPWRKQSQKGRGVAILKDKPHRSSRSVH